MSRNAARQKKLIRWVLAAVLAADVVLIVVNLRTGPSAQARRDELQKLEDYRDLLAADVRRASAIRQRLPAVQRECDQFFAEQLRDAATGYSSIETDLGAIAREAGLRTDAVAFRQHAVGNRHVDEVEVNATVAGDYPSVVKFINGLERSRNFYVLDSLSLASETGGKLKLNLKLRTYFRS